jgi:hypothetical protein
MWLESRVDRVIGRKPVPGADLLADIAAEYPISKPGT